MQEDATSNHLIILMLFGQPVTHCLKERVSTIEIDRVFNPNQTPQNVLLEIHHKFCHLLFSFLH